MIKVNLDILEEDKKCGNCNRGAAIENESCPYASEIHDCEDPCEHNCCESCREQCYLDT